MIKHDDTDFHDGLGEPNLGDVVDVQCRPVRHAEDIAFDAVRADGLRMIAKMQSRQRLLKRLRRDWGRDEGF